MLRLAWAQAEGFLRMQEAEAAEFLCQGQRDLPDHPVLHHLQGQLLLLPLFLLFRLLDHRPPHRRHRCRIAGPAAPHVVSQ